jgi:hypothetical protein
MNGDDAQTIKQFFYGLKEAHGWGTSSSVKQFARELSCYCVNNKNANVLGDGGPFYCWISSRQHIFSSRL